MGKTRSIALCLSATVALAALCSLAQGEVSQKQGVRVTVNAGIAPKRLPRKGSAPVAVSVKGDLVLERDDGAVAGIEVKAGERVGGADFRGLRKLRDGLGDRFLGGVVIHLGGRAYSQDDRLHALPAESLWLAAEA